MIKLKLIKIEEIEEKNEVVKEVTLILRSPSRIFLPINQQIK